MNLVTNKLADADHHLHAIVVVDLGMWPSAASS